MKSFGEYVKELRIKKGFNQTELAALIGLDSGGLSKVENGKKQLKEEKLILLSEAVGVDLAKIKIEYFSEKFAKDSFQYECSETVFQVAEEKARYMKSINVKQGDLEL